MAHKDSGWRPEGSVHTYYGHEVWDHDDVGPHQINPGEVDPDWVDEEGREETPGGDADDEADVESE